MSTEVPCVQTDLSPTWTNFTQTTSVHGVKYIFDGGSVKLRRWLWCFLVTVAILLLIGQVGLRVAAYFKYKSNVDVKIKYVDEIDFPAVTVCNQNNHRLTATVGWNLYNFMDHMYSSHHVRAMQLDTSTLDINTTEFMLSTAHHKEDLIDRTDVTMSGPTKRTDVFQKHLYRPQGCDWNEKVCDEKDFGTIITNLGVCYTFNGKTPALRVVQSGPGSGLSLILNVEYYEYMKGPQTDAGVKIYLHAPDEIPHMRNSGFAVGPGMHILVGIKRSKVAYQVSIQISWGKVHPVPLEEWTVHRKKKTV